jgi:hypothetical protein
MENNAKVSYTGSFGLAPVMGEGQPVYGAELPNDEPVYPDTMLHVYVPFEIEDKCYQAVLDCIAANGYPSNWKKLRKEKK